MLSRVAVRARTDLPFYAGFRAIYKPAGPSRPSLSRHLHSLFCALLRRSLVRCYNSQRTPAARGCIVRSCTTLCASIVFAVPGAVGYAQTSPAIEITALPRYGQSPGIISGRVTGGPPSAFKVAPLIFLSGLGYYSKPFCNATTVTPDASSGQFSANLTTGGIDQYASQIALLLVPASANVPCFLGVAGIPEELEGIAAAKLIVPRPDPNTREITFAVAGNHSATALMQAGKFTAPPNPSKARNRPKPNALCAVACSAAACSTKWLPPRNRSWCRNGR